MPLISYESALENLCNSTGNTWMSSSQVESYFKKYNAGSLSMLTPLIQKEKIKVAKKDGQTLLTCSKFYQSEIHVVNNIFRIMKAKIPSYSNDYLDSMIDLIEQDKNTKLHKDQRAAVKKAVNSSFMVLTGGPGTGKTFVLNFIHEVHKLINKNMRIDYTAPTGKAARRITESTGFPATTLHSKLQITADKPTPEALSSDIKLLIVDEISMLDIFIMNALTQAVATGTKLILVGDTDQLPSVGPGAVLRDLINSHVVPTAALTATFRQDGDSILFDNIQRIKKGDAHLISGEDFKIAVPNNGLSPHEILLWLYKQEAKEYGMENVMCLTPFRRKGIICSNKINIEIQKYVNPTGASFDNGYGTIFRKGDIVMQLNNRELVANGDIGIVNEVYKTGISVKFIDCEVHYTASTISDLTLAYAMSIHKSQGSEAKSVITTLLPENKIMLQRNLLYTAVTRAKLKHSLLCEPKAIKDAIDNVASNNRITLLQELLIYKATGKLPA